MMGAGVDGSRVCVPRHVSMNEWVGGWMDGWMAAAAAAADTTAAAREREGTQPKMRWRCWWMLLELQNISVKSWGGGGALVSRSGPV